MTTLQRFLSGALAFGMTIAGVSQAQQREERRDERRQERREGQPREAVGTPREVESSRTGEVRAPQARKAKNILGSKVSIRGNLAIGTVDDIIFNDDGYIDYLVVINEGKYVLVPWQAAKFDFEQRTATLEITQDRFREVPTFTQDQWPNVYEPSYQQKVYTYYGLKQGPERRFERREGVRRR